MATCAPAAAGERGVGKAYGGIALRSSPNSLNFHAELSGFSATSSKNWKMGESPVRLFPQSGLLSAWLNEQLSHGAGIWGEIYRLSWVDWKDETHMGKRNSRRNRANHSNQPVAPEILESRLLLTAKGGPEIVPGELLVQYNSGVTAAGRNVARAGMGVQVAETIQTKTMQKAGFGVMERVQIGRAHV